MKSLRLSRSSLPWVIAIVSMVLAMGSTGYAAKKYVLSSTKQISPSVLKQLRGAKGPAGAQGPAGVQGAAGPAGAAGATGPAGTARASAQVVTGANPTYDANKGFASPPRRISVGTYCVPAPAGINPDKTAVFVSPSGTTVGFVTQAGPPSTVCRADEFEIKTADTGNVLTDAVFFNILVP